MSSGMTSPDAAGRDRDGAERQRAEELIVAGADALDAGDLTAALARFTPAIESADEEIAGRAALGAAEALLRLGRDAEAIELLRRAAEAGDRTLRFQALRRLATALVNAGDLESAIDVYRGAERQAPDARTRTQIATRIAWLTQETGGSARTVRAAFSRSLGEERWSWVIRVMLIVTAAVSVAAFFWTDLWIGLALIKFNGGSDILSAEPWRLLTVALVHGSPLEAGIGAIQGTAVHLFFNLFALDLGARLVFRLYGVGRLLLWYGLGVVAASLASAIWLPTTPSVGASGGVFALFGIALGAEWSYRPLVERGARAALGQIGGLIVINLLLGFGLNVAGGGIDNAAHIGGLVCGLLLGATIAPMRAESLHRRWGGAPTIAGIREGLIVAGIAALLLVTFIFWPALAQLRATLPI